MDQGACGFCVNMESFKVLMYVDLCIDVYELVHAGI